MTIVQTTATITSTDTDYNVPGDLTPTQFVAAYSSQIPGLSNMTYEERVETRDIGQVRVITFKPKTGTKG